MILADYLQSHDPIPSHPDEVLQRPLPPMALLASRNDQEPPELASATSAGSNDQFHIRIRSDTHTDNVNRFLEIFNRIANRHVSQPEQPQPGPSASGGGSTPGGGGQPQNVEADSSSSSDEEQNQGFLLLPADR